MRTNFWDRRTDRQTDRRTDRPKSSTLYPSALRGIIRPHNTVEIAASRIVNDVHVQYVGVMMDSNLLWIY